MASSRVGARINARGCMRLPSGVVRDNSSRIGSAKAAVLPVPVWAMPSKSSASRRTGIAFAWIGVGTRCTRSFKARRIGSARPSSENVSSVKGNPCAPGWPDGALRLVGPGVSLLPGAAGAAGFLVLGPGTYAPYVGVSRDRERICSPHMGLDVCFVKKIRILFVHSPALDRPKTIFHPVRIRCREGNRR